MTWDMDLRTVFWITKYAEDEDKLFAYMKENSAYVENVPELIYDAIESTTGSTALKLLRSRMKTEKNRQRAWCWQWKRIIWISLKSLAMPKGKFLPSEGG